MATKVETIQKGLRPRVTEKVSDRRGPVSSRCVAHTYYLPISLLTCQDDTQRCAWAAMLSIVLAARSGQWACCTLDQPGGAVVRPITASLPVRGVFCFLDETHHRAGELD